MQDERQPDLVGLSAEIVSAYVAKNHIQTSEIPQLIASVHDALRNVTRPAPQPEKHEPLVPINKTIRPDYIISLEDGRQYKSLKRHLSSRGLTPEQYRKKWDLRPDYPMVAANYARLDQSWRRRLASAKRGRVGSERPRRIPPREALHHGFPSTSSPTQAGGPSADFDPAPADPLVSEVDAPHRDGFAR